MLNNLLKNTKFKSEIKKFFKKHESEIADIILFGSAVKGKESPADIDVLVVYKQKKNQELSYELKNILRKFHENIQITSKEYNELFDPMFKAREAFLSEGYSLIQDNFISEGFGYKNMILFRYNLQKFNKSERMRFYYSLYGRKKQDKGVLASLDSVKFAETVILCPVTNKDKMKEYLDGWKIEYIEFPVLIPQRMISLIER